MYEGPLKDSELSSKNRFQVSGLGSLTEDTHSFHDTQSFRMWSAEKASKLNTNGAYTAPETDQGEDPPSDN